MSERTSTAESTQRLKTSVTALADFACRVGDLELTGAVGPTALEGMRAHQEIQSERSVDSEVRVRCNTTVHSVDVTLSGRVDLLDAQNHVLGEIKTTMVPVAHVSESQRTLHWAQVMLYGYCYSRQLADEEAASAAAGISLELIYYDIRARKQTPITRQVSLQELEQFANVSLEKFVQWHKLLWRLQDQTRRSAASLEFPHKQFRPGQRDMSAAIYRSTRDGDTLLCEAPTGTGKTVSSLFPVMKAIGEGLVDHAVYLTAKTSGRASAMQSVRLLEQHGLALTAVMIRSKQPTCFCTNGRCERDDAGTCPMTVGFFDRLPDARDEAMNTGVLDAQRLDDIAWAHQLCPFEFALQLLPWVTLAICDFNYVFDPLVRLARFKESRRDTVLLVDEAHNLVDRARNMHSGELLRSQCQQSAQEVSQSHPVLARRLDALAAALLKIGRGQQDETVVADDAPDNVRKASSAVVEAYMEAAGAGPAMPDSLFDMFKQACRYSTIDELYTEQHRTLISISRRAGRKDVSVTLKCLDAARFLETQFRLFRSTVVFSATLRPGPFYRSALGLAEDTRQLQLASPFNPDNALYAVVTYIDTRYRQRSGSAPALVELIAESFEKKTGNYMVFFPSYAYLQQVHELFTRTHPDVDTWVQSRHADVAEREKLLSGLSAQKPRIGFAILGGVFGEGVDYPGELLIGAIVVGVGLPGTGIEQDLIAAHYRSLGLDGFDYAYRYPGFTRVLQTAGRVIRTETDRGVILLVDDRFNQAFYQGLFPAHWQIRLARDPGSLRNQLQAFWA